MRRSPVSSLAIVVLMTFALVTGQGEARAAVPGALSVTSLKIRGLVFKGPVSGATVKIFTLRRNGSVGTRLATRVTDASGCFSVRLSPAPVAPFLVKASGGSFIDEATGDTEVLDAVDTLTAVVLPGTKSVSVTPLTHMAAVRARALARAGVPLKTAVKSSLAGVARQYALADIVKTRPAAANDENAVRTATLEQRNYGLVLAGLAREAADLNARAIDLASALAEDVGDGTLDGMNGAVPVSLKTRDGGTSPLSASAGTSDLQAAIDAFAASASNKTSIPQKATVVSPVGVGVNGAGLFYTTSSVLPAWISGQAGSATLKATGGTKPYQCSLDSGSSLPPGFTISSDCVLAGTAEILPPGTTMRITPPFTIVMRDSAMPPASANLELRVTIVAPGPTIWPAGGNCWKGLPCLLVVATATGGTPPYYFASSSFAGGAPPLGTSVGLDGVLSGVPAALGTYTFGVTVVDLVGATDSGRATVTVTEPPRFRLSVDKTGNGRGRVTSAPPGIDCGADCAQKFPVGRQVTLTAAPASGSSFLGWSGDCGGTGDCLLLMDSAKNVTANFSHCAGTGESCASAPCCTGSCVPNNYCPDSDPTAAYVCYGPCGSYPVDCGNYCCPSGYPVCGGDCWCWEW